MQKKKMEDSEWILYDCLGDCAIRSNLQAFSKDERKVTKLTKRQKEIRNFKNRIRVLKSRNKLS